MPFQSILHFSQGLHLDPSSLLLFWAVCVRHLACSPITKRTEPKGNPLIASLSFSPKKLQAACFDRSRTSPVRRRIKLGLFRETAGTVQLYVQVRLTH